MEGPIGSAQTPCRVSPSPWSGSPRAGSAPREEVPLPFPFSHAKRYRSALDRPYGYSTLVDFLPPPSTSELGSEVDEVELPPLAKLSQPPLPFPAPGLELPRGDLSRAPAGADELLIGLHGIGITRSFAEITALGCRIGLGTPPSGNPSTSSNPSPWRLAEWFPKPIDSNKPSPLPSPSG